MQHFLSADEIAALPEARHQHQFNANAVRLTRSIGAALGLTRIGVHIVRLTPGRDSTHTPLSRRGRGVHLRARGQRDRPHR